MRLDRLTWKADITVLVMIRNLSALEEGGRSFGGYSELGDQALLLDQGFPNCDLGPTSGS